MKRPEESPLSREAGEALIERLEGDALTADDRRVLIRWDKKVRNSLGFLHLACAYITYRQSGPIGIGS